MKKILFLLAFFTANALLAQDLVILHTNDLHSHLNGLAPETEYTPFVNDNDPTRGGFSRIAGFIKSEREKNSNKVIVVDAGDFLMGSLFHTQEVDNGFQLFLMKTMGYDYVGLGNHEFDFGPNMLAKIISSNQKRGAIPQLLSDNYLKAKDGSDSDLVKKFEDKTILPYVITERNGYKIGVFSVLGTDAVSAIAGYVKVSFEKAKKAAVKTAHYLKQKEKVDLVVVLSHSGVGKDKKGEWNGEDVELGKAAPDIDVIISGHTHTRLTEPIKAGNAVVVQTGCFGSSMGKVEITFDKNKKPLFNYQLVPMDDKIVADKSIQNLIDQQSVLVEKNILEKLKVTFNEPIFETDFDLTMDEKIPEGSTLGPLISDAVYHYLNKTNHENVDITIVPTGVIFGNIKPGKYGKQNINDIFNLMPLGVSADMVPGSPIGKIYISGNELKKVFELILTVYPLKNDYYLYFTGMQLTYNPKKGLFHKISEIKIGTEEKGYQTVSFSKKDKRLYCISANKYTLSFIGAIKKMSYGIVNVVGKNADGSVIKNDNFLIDIDKEKEGIQEAKEWIAILDYVRTFPDLNGNKIPDVPAIYKTKVNSVTVKK